MDRRRDRDRRRQPAARPAAALGRAGAGGGRPAALRARARLTGRSIRVEVPDPNRIRSAHEPSRHTRGSSLPRRAAHVAGRQPAGGAARLAAAASSASATRSAASGAASSTRRGYAGLTWPKEYGGAGAPYSFQAIFYEEMARAQAPAHVGVIGLGMAGPTIIAHGTEEQKQALPREDPLGGGDLVPGLLRARRRLRPRRRAHARGARGRRLRRQRPEGVVVVRAHRRLVHPRHAQRSGRAALHGPDAT